MSADLFGGGIADPQSLNRYAYVGNNPTNFVDSSGAFKQPCSASRQGIVCPNFGDGWIEGSDFNPFDGWDASDFPAIFGNGLFATYAGPCGLGAGASASCTSYGDIINVNGLTPTLDSLDSYQVVGGDEGPLDVTYSSYGSEPGASAGNTNAAAGCEGKILARVNKQFGTNFSNSNVIGTSPNGGAVNLYIQGTSADGLTASEFNAIQPGRYTNAVGYLTGFGPSLHITGPGLFDPQGVFSSTNVGGDLSVTFTAHIDSAFAYNPLGLLLHLFIDVLGHGSRSPCP